MCLCRLATVKVRSWCGYRLEADSDTALSLPVGIYSHPILLLSVCLCVQYCRHLAMLCCHLLGLWLQAPSPSKADYWQYTGNLVLLSRSLPRNDRLYGNSKNLTTLKGLKIHPGSEGSEQTVCFWMTMVIALWIERNGLSFFPLKDLKCIWQFLLLLIMT